MTQQVSVLGQNKTEIFAKPSYFNNDQSNSQKSMQLLKVVGFKQ